MRKVEAERHDFAATSLRRLFVKCIEVEEDSAFECEADGG